MITISICVWKILFYHSLRNPCKRWISSLLRKSSSIIQIGWKICICRPFAAWFRVSVHCSWLPRVDKCSDKYLIDFSRDVYYTSYYISDISMYTVTFTHSSTMLVEIVWQAYARMSATYYAAGINIIQQNLWSYVGRIIDSCNDLVRHN